MERLSDKVIYDILVGAKKLYCSDALVFGMCFSIDAMASPLCPSLGYQEEYTYLYDLIPEFNPVDLNAPYKIMSGYWWPKDDQASRLRAFDKLISIYREKL